MKRLILIVPIVLFGVLAYFLFKSLIGPAPDVLKSALIDKPAPRLTLPALDAQTKGFGPAQLTAGHVTVVNVFGSWCPTCREEAPVLPMLAHLKDVAARPMELAKDNTDMHQRLQELDLQTHVLKEENAALRDRTNRDWFLAGAGVLLLGLVLGIIVPRLRKRSGWTDWH